MVFTELNCTMEDPGNIVLPDAENPICSPENDDK